MTHLSSFIATAWQLSTFCLTDTFCPSFTPPGPDSTRNRVRTDHGKPGKSWKFWNTIFQACKVMEFLSGSWKILILIMEKSESVRNYGWDDFFCKKKIYLIKTSREQATKCLHLALRGFTSGQSNLFLHNHEVTWLSLCSESNRAQEHEDKRCIGGLLLCFVFFLDFVEDARPMPFSRCMVEQSSICPIDWGL